MEPMMLVWFRQRTWELEFQAEKEPRQLWHRILRSQDLRCSRDFCWFMATGVTIALPGWSSTFSTRMPPLSSSFSGSRYTSILHTPKILIHFNFNFWQQSAFSFIADFLVQWWSIRFIWCFIIYSSLHCRHSLWVSTIESHQEKFFSPIRNFIKEDV